MNTRLMFAALVAVTPLIAAPGPVSTPTDDAATPGAELFARHCAVCHTIGGGPAMGPDLAGVTTRRSSEWLLRWIDDPAGQARTDSTARSLVAAWGGWVMPSLELTGPEIIDLVDFLTQVDAGAIDQEALSRATTSVCPMGGGVCPMCRGGGAGPGPGGGGHGHGHGHGARRGH